MGSRRWPRPATRARTSRRHSAGIVLDPAPVPVLDEAGRWYVLDLRAGGNCWVGRYRGLRRRVVRSLSVHRDRSPCSCSRLFQTSLWFRSTAGRTRPVGYSWLCHSQRQKASGPVVSLRPGAPGSSSSTRRGLRRSVQGTASVPARGGGDLAGRRRAVGVGVGDPVRGHRWRRREPPCEHGRWAQMDIGDLLSGAAGVGFDALSGGPYGASVRSGFVRFDGPFGPFPPRPSTAKSRVTCANCPPTSARLGPTSDTCRSTGLTPA